MSATYSSTLWPQPFGISYHRTIRLPYSNLRSSLRCSALLYCSTVLCCGIRLCVSMSSRARYSNVEAPLTPRVRRQVRGPRLGHGTTSALLLNQLWLVESSTADPLTYPFRLLSFQSHYSFPSSPLFSFLLLSGEQVLARLKFEGTVRDNLFGLGIVLIGFTFTAYISLLFSRISYLPLGHVGRGQKSRAKDVIPQKSSSRLDMVEDVGVPSDGLNVTKEA